ncbi:MAG: hypothetical protein IJ991_17420, partial [Thermoguttaceae bacterium]|nr:hypothetical protein [Thermoguttaceae bacterium]
MADEIGRTAFDDRYRETALGRSGELTAQEPPNDGASKEDVPSFADALDLTAALRRLGRLRRRRNDDEAKTDAKVMTVQASEKAIVIICGSASRRSAIDGCIRKSSAADSRHITP